MQDISIDLETLGTRYDAPVLAIGAALFDRDSGKIGATFYEEIDFASAVRSGRPDGNTIAWWMQQSKEAQRIFWQSSQGEKRALATALQMFGDWARSAAAGVPIVWGNGATFDISILEHAYDKGAVGLKEPWHFMNIRDIRTIVDVCFDVTGIQPGSRIDNVGVKHHARDDAVYQANLVVEALRCLRQHGKPAVGKADPVKTAKSKPAIVDDDEL